MLSVMAISAWEVVEAMFHFVENFRFVATKHLNRLANYVFFSDVFLNLASATIKNPKNKTSSILYNYGKFNKTITAL